MSKLKLDSKGCIDTSGIDTPMGVTPCEHLGIKVGDRFLFKGVTNTFAADSIVELYHDEGTLLPLFKLIKGACLYNKAGGHAGAYTNIRNLQPLNSTPKVPLVLSEEGGIDARESVLPRFGETPTEALGFKVGDKFIAIRDGNVFAGSLVELYFDDGSTIPEFKILHTTDVHRSFRKDPETGDMVSYVSYSGLLPLNNYEIKQAEKKEESDDDKDAEVTPKTCEVPTEGPHQYFVVIKDSQGVPAGTFVRTKSESNAEGHILLGGVRSSEWPTLGWGDTGIYLEANKLVPVEYKDIPEDVLKAPEPKTPTWVSDISIKFVHLGDDSDVNRLFGIRSTICYQIKGSTIHVGFTEVHPKDQYVKKLGRELAYKRMMQKPVIFTLEDYMRDYRNQDFHESFVDKSLRGGAGFNDLRAAAIIDFVEKKVVNLLMSHM